MWSRLLLVSLIVVCSHQTHRQRRQGVNFDKGCQTPRKTTGQCINIRQCPELIEMLKRNKELGVTEYLRASQCGYENKDPKVCCPGEGTPATTLGDRTPPNTGAGGLPTQCGITDSQISRIVSGRPALLGSWPWMVALGYRSAKKPLDWLCGASLISNRYVLTAAHCVTNLGGRTLYLARLGDLNLDDSVQDKATPVDIPIERAIAHENYDAARHTVDVALIKLQKQVQFTKLIQPICIPLSDTFKRDLEGYSPFVIGWGAISYRGPSTTALQEAQIEITSEDSCSNAYRNIKGATIDERVICALSPLGRDACQGDSGGPLILPKQSKFFLVGVVSYGYKCAEPGFPGIYTRVSLYTDWIKKNMN